MIVIETTKKADISLSKDVGFLVRSTGLEPVLG